MPGKSPAGPESGWNGRRAPLMDVRGSAAPKGAAVGGLSGLAGARPESQRLLRALLDVLARSIYDATGLEHSRLFSSLLTIDVDR